MRALIVEDELLTAIHLESELLTIGVETVGIAVDRQEARSFFESAPDIAFIDVNLRDGPTGPIIARELRQVDVPVVYFTANPCQIPLDALEGNGIISKPFDHAQLVDALSRYGRSRRAEAPRVLQ